MLTDFVRDHAFTIAWFGLVACAWFGWGQEDPPRHWQWRLGVSSAVGLLFAGIFGYSVAIRWNDGTALEGRYEWFGVLVGIEVLLAAVGCVLLWRRQLSRWMSWWVALIVALHFIPLAFILNDASLAALGLIQLAGLGLLLPKLRAERFPTSRLVGPMMGASLLIFATASTIVFIAQNGAPW